MPGIAIAIKMKLWPFYTGVAAVASADSIATEDGTTVITTEGGIEIGTEGA